MKIKWGRLILFLESSKRSHCFDLKRTVAAPPLLEEVFIGNVVAADGLTPVLYLAYTCNGEPFNQEWDYGRLGLPDQLTPAQTAASIFGDMLRSPDRQQQMVAR